MTHRGCWCTVTLLTIGICFASLVSSHNTPHKTPLPDIEGDKFPGPLLSTSGARKLLQLPFSCSEGCQLLILPEDPSAQVCQCSAPLPPLLPPLPPSPPSPPPFPPPPPSPPLSPPPPPGPPQPPRSLRSVRGNARRPPSPSPQPADGVALPPMPTPGDIIPGPLLASQLAAMSAGGAPSNEISS